jgi:hypothetical protein
VVDYGGATLALARNPPHQRHALHFDRVLRKPSAQQALLHELALMMAVAHAFEDGATGVGPKHLFSGKIRMSTASRHDSHPVRDDCTASTRLRIE